MATMEIEDDLAYLDAVAKEMAHEERFGPDNNAREAITGDDFDSYFARHAVGEDVGSGTPHGKKKGALLCRMFCKKKTDCPVVGAFMRSFKDAQEFKVVSGKLFQIMEKNVTFDVSDAEIEAAYDVSKRDAEEYLRNNIVQVIPVTPFNNTSVLANDAGIRAEGGSLSGLVFKMGEFTETIPIDDPKICHQKVVELLRGYGASSRKVVYEFLGYNERYIQITIALMVRYEISVEYGELKLRLRHGYSDPPEERPKEMTPLIGVSRKVDEFLEKIMNQLDGVGVSYASNTAPRAIIYALLCSGTLKENNAEAWVCFDHIRNFFDAKIKTFFSNGVESEIEQYRLAQETRADNAAQQANDVLTRSREWRRNSPEADSISHDFCKEKKIVHMPDNRWGVANTLACLKFMAYDVKARFNKMMLVGPGADELAEGIDILGETVPVLGGKDVTGKRTPVPKLICSPGNNVHHENCEYFTLKDGINVDKRLDDSELALVMLVNFQGESAASKRAREADETGKSEEFAVPITLEQFVQECLKKKGVFAVQHNLANDETFTGLILPILNHPDFLIRFWRHPRLHNNSYYLIFSNVWVDKPSPLLKKRNRVDSAVFRIRLANQVLRNNALRNWSLMYGCEPKPCKDEPHSDLIFGFSIAYSLSMLLKTEAKRAINKRVHKTDLLADLVRGDIMETEETTLVPGGKSAAAKRKAAGDTE